VERARLILPSGPVTDAKLQAGLEILEQLGIPWVLHEPQDSADVPYLAGSDAHRADSLSLAATQAEPLLMVRGGYGAIRTLHALPSPFFETSDRPALWGFSDGTALLAAWEGAGWPCWSAPPIIQLPRLDADSLERFVLAWQEGTVPDFTGLQSVVAGTATGRLAGGNLCVLASLVGTPWQASLDGTILVLEDIGEPPYKVDRLFTQLELSGCLDRVAGVVLGEFSGLNDADAATVRAFFHRTLQRLGKPAARGLPFGHGSANACLPMGREATLKAGEGGLASLVVAP